MRQPVKMIAYKYCVNLAKTEFPYQLTLLLRCITHSHGSASVLKATKQVNGKGQNSTPRHTKTP